MQESHSRESGAPSSNSGHRFHRVTIYAPDFKPYSSPRSAWLSISSCLRWKYIKSEDEEPPQNFTAFRGQHSLTLERVSPQAGWTQVEEGVHFIKMENGQGISVVGMVRGRKRALLRMRPVRFIIVSTSVHLLNVWISGLQGQIASWELVYRRKREELLDSTQRDLQNILACVQIPVRVQEITWSSSEEAEPAAKQSTGACVDAVTTILNFVETLTTVVATSAPSIQEAAEQVGNLAKSLTIVGSAFQVVSLCFAVVDMACEMKRSGNALGAVQQRINTLRGKVLQSMVPILHSDGQVDELLVSNMFKVQERVMNGLGDVERYLMSNRLLQFLNAKRVREMERNLEEIEEKVVSVVQTKEVVETKVAVVKHEIQIKRYESAIIRQQSTSGRQGRTLRKHGSAIERYADEIEALKDAKRTNEVITQRERPMLTPYFVGREDELRILEEKLVKYGSAAIVRFGGAGKTQLLIAFAEQAEKKSLIPGGCFWVPAQGLESDITRSLGDLVESLLGKRLPIKHRNDRKLLLSTLRKELKSRNKNWLICLDNADEPEVNPIVGELCRMTEGGKSPGWVLVTSRQGGGDLWDGMKSEQLLRLDALPDKHAMLVLLRWKTGKLKMEEDDSELFRMLDSIRVNDPEEYDALLKLAGNKEYGLGGIALALAQVGSYIRRSKVSFAKYLELYKRARYTMNFDKLFRDICDEGQIRKDQRSLSTTWKINVDGMSADARLVLRVCALFELNVPKLLVEKIEESIPKDELESREVMVEELLNRGSLLETENELDGNLRMHRLVRDFLIWDAKQELAGFQTAMMRAICVLYDCIHTQLSLYGRCIDDLTEWYDFEIRELAPHASSVLRYAQDIVFSESMLPYLEKLVDVYRFASRCATYFHGDGTAEDLATLFSRLAEKLIATGKGQILKAASLNEQAVNEMMFGNLQVADEKIQQAQAIFRQLSNEGQKTPNFSSTLIVNGQLLLKRRQFHDAAALIQEGIELQLKLHGRNVDNASVALAMFQLASVLHASGDLTEACRFYQQSFDMRARLTETDNHMSDARRAYFTVACDLFKHGKFVESEFFFRKSGENSSSVFGLAPAPVDMAIPLQLISQKLYDSNAIAAAKKLLLESLDLYADVDYRNDIDFVDLTESSDLVLEHKEQLLGSTSTEELFKNLIDFHKRLFDDQQNHAGIARIAFQLGLQASRNMDYDSAERYYHESLAISEKILFGKDDVSVSTTMVALGKVLEMKRTINESEDLYQKSLAMERRMCTTEFSCHDGILLALRALIELLLKAGRLKEAEALIRERVKLLEETQVDGYHSCFLCAMLYRLGDSSMQSSCFVEAERLFRECLVLIRDSFEDSREKHLCSSIILFRLAFCALSTGRIDQVEGLIQECYCEREPEILPKYCFLDFAEDCLSNFDFNQLCAWAFENLDQFCIELAEVVKKVADYGHDIEHTLLQIASLAYGKGKYKVAEKLCLVYLDANCRSPQKSPGETESFAKYALAQTKKKLGLLDESETLYKESLEMDKQMYHEEPDHFNITATLRALGDVRLEKQSFVQAEQSYREWWELAKKDPVDCLPIEVDFYELTERAFNDCALNVAHMLFSKRLELLRENDESSHEIALSLRSVARAAVRKHDYKEAVSLLQDSLDMVSRLCGNDDPDVDVATAMDWRGWVEKNYDSFGNARLWFQRSLDMHRCLKDNEYNIALMLCRLGHCTFKGGDLNEGERLLNESLDLLREINRRGIYDSDIAWVLNTKGLLLFEKREFNRAKQLLLSSIEMERRLDNERSGNERLDFLDPMLDLVNLFIDIGEFNEAEELLEECITFARAVLGSKQTHMRMTDILYFQATLALDKGNVEEADRLVEDSLSVLHHLYGEKANRLDTSRTLNLKARVSLSRNEIAEAETLIIGSMSIMRRIVGEELDHKSIADALLVQSRVAVAKGELELASSSCRASLEMRKRIHGANGIQLGIAECLHVLGKIHFKLEKFDAAVVQTRNSLELYKQLFPGIEKHWRILEVDHDLSSFRTKK